MAFIEKAVERWVLPLWKAFHKGNYRKFLFMERFSERGPRFL